MKPVERKNILQKGQTLIETVVAAFVLTMGIAAAVGLAVYAFNSSTSTTSQIIGMGLAREGIEAVKNARDTNWLQQTTIDQDCYNFASSTANNSRCYKGWMDQSLLNGYNIDPGGNPSNHFGVSVNPANPFKLWNIVNLGANPSLGQLQLTSNSDVALGTFAGYYQTGLPGTPSGYYREIFIDENGSAAPYNQDVGPLLTVTSRVWWTGGKCGPSASYNAARESCRVQLITYLTNWKTY